jgi:hypothetical protein
MSEIKLEDLEIAEFSKDVAFLTLKVPQMIDRATAEEIKAGFNRAVPDHPPLVILMGGIELIELTDQQLADIGLQRIPKPVLCPRCGLPYGGIGHGPGFCIDRREK